MFNLIVEDYENNNIYLGLIYNYIPLDLIDNDVEEYACYQLVRSSIVNFIIENLEDSVSIFQEDMFRFKYKYDNYKITMSLFLERQYLFLCNRYIPVEWDFLYDILVLLFGHGPNIISELCSDILSLINNMDVIEYTMSYKFDLFKGDLIQEGSDVTIIASGILVSEALKASEILSQKNIKPEIINIHTIKPIDEEIIIKSAQKTRKVITCENHNILGGLGSAVCEVLSKNLPTPVETIGIKDIFGEVGKLQELKNKFEMTADDIVKAYYKLKTKFN